jgi:DNA invertase Pin-like site-specific DNA recombinase
VDGSLPNGSGCSVVIPDLAISPAACSYLHISDELNRKGVTLTVLDQGIDTSTSQGRLQFGLLSVVAEFERVLISERTKTALAGRDAGKEGRPTQGPIPQGYGARPTALRLRPDDRQGSCSRSWGERSHFI